ncbi:type II toxin-antitoxin system VapC family toxin [Methylopila sp. M107]|uniref:type II toxin-antitoxin system VapC family toxin n=1 Tax=Methylopila sp. M107 TaxID=1101190 RepID=UPI000382E053|nr:type II toxin-antitoxin system VapC family toxin [Methylopila sp. M107]
MIVLDTSAIIAILNAEPERLSFYEAIWASDRRLVSAVTYQEAGQVMIGRRGVNGLYDLEDFLTLIKAEIVPHTADLAAMAVYGFQRFGKGLDPRARLNMGDCATYALAKSLSAPILFKSDDFIHTDVEQWR